MKPWSQRAVRTLQYLMLGMVCQVSLAQDFTGIVTVEISGLKGATGSVFIAVYDSDSTWLSDETVLEKKVVIAESLEGDLVRTELQLPLGEYALSAFYDEDDDGELDTNFVGMAREPTALSNNAVGKFGSPKYSDAVFQVGAEPIIQSIFMREM